LPPLGLLAFLLSLLAGVVVAEEVTVVVAVEVLAQVLGIKIILALHRVVLTL